MQRRSQRRDGGNPVRPAGDGQPTTIRQERRPGRPKEVSTGWSWAMSVMEEAGCRIDGGLTGRLAETWDVSQIVRTVRPGRAVANAQAHARARGLSVHEILARAVDEPSLLRNPPKAQRDRLERLSEALGVPLCQLKRAAKRTERLSALEPDDVRQQVEVLASGLDWPPAAIIDMVLVRPDILELKTAGLQRRLAQLTGVLGLDAARLETVIRRDPQWLFENPGAIEQVVDHLMALGARSQVKVRALLARDRRLAGTDPAVLSGRIEGLRMALGLETADAVNLMIRQPVLALVSPGRLSEGLHFLRQSSGLPERELISIVVAVPTLLVCAPRTLRRKAKLVMRLAAATGQKATLADILRTCPSVLSFAVPRLLVRYWIARHRLRGGRWSAIASATDASCARLIDRVAARTDAGSRDCLRSVRKRMR
jgi:hypothetical protein